MNNDAIRRQLGCGPSGRYDMTKQTSHIVKPEQPKRPQMQRVGGAWMTFDGGTWRFSTIEEIKTVE